MKLKTVIFDDIAIKKALTRISYEILERSLDIKNVILVGIKTRGVPIAEILRDNIFRHGEISIPVYELDTTAYRDDEKKNPSAALQNFDVTGKEVIIVDDVLFTGRTTRAAMDALLSMGRAKAIKLAVLVDRGHRELPIRADYVGKNLPTSTREKVVVKIVGVDDENSVSLYSFDA